LIRDKPFKKRKTFNTHCNFKRNPICASLSIGQKFDICLSVVYIINQEKKMAKKKKSVSRVRKSANIEFNSWTFFLFALFVLFAAITLVAQQKGLRIF
jgi:hypothetical protein